MEGAGPTPQTRFAPLRWYAELTATLGRHRRFFLPLGVLALLALGVHAAADLFADWAFLALDLFDRGLEDLYARVAGGLLGAGQAQILWFQDLVDLRDKEVLARWMALLVELAIDLRLGVAAWAAAEFRAPAAHEAGEYNAEGRGSWSRLASRLGQPIRRARWVLGCAAHYLRNPSVEKLYLPLAVSLASITGALALFVALDNALFGLGHALPKALRAWRWLSPWPAALAATTALWRLAWPAVVGSLVRCQRRVERDLARGDPPWARSLRGVWGAVLILPLLLAGVWMATPLGGWVRQILLGRGP